LRIHSRDLLIAVVRQTKVEVRVIRRIVGMLLLGFAALNVLGLMAILVRFGEFRPRPLVLGLVFAAIGMWVLNSGRRA
jgi:hypothetical protein